METVIISDKIQEFDGERFYLCGNYFQHRGKRLHRTVWQYHNGAIPKGYHVHHKDENKSNNSIENLELVKAEEHSRYHMNNEARKARSREIADRIRPLTKAWHSSPEGRAWHSKHAKETQANRKLYTYNCTYCGKEFQSYMHYKGDRNRFCHNNCRAAYRRWRLKHESSLC